MKKTKKMGIWAVAVIAILAFASGSYGASFTWTDTTSGVGGTVYTLDLTADTLTAQTSVHSGWYIDWISFKLDGGTAAEFSSLTGPTVAWTVENGFPQSTWSGFSVTDSTLPPANETVVQSGALLNGATYTWTFDWTLNGAPLNATPSIQVGYYDGEKSNGGFNQTRMSQKFQVPEPTTLLLLGLGLVGLAGLRRFKK